MQYLGGKSKIAKYLVAAIRPVLGGRPFWDAFCGGLSVSVALSDAAGAGLVTDANPALVSLYQAVAGGWDPPEELSEAEYAAARALPDSDPRKAFAGFGCSFGGKWFGGYARNPKAGAYASSARCTRCGRVFARCATVARSHVRSRADHGRASRCRRPRTRRTRTTG